MLEKAFRTMVQNKVATASLKVLLQQVADEAGREAEGNIATAKEVAR